MALDQERINRRVENYLNVLMSKPETYIHIRSHSVKHRCRSEVYDRLITTLKLMGIPYHAANWRIRICSER